MRRRLATAAALVALAAALLGLSPEAWATCVPTARGLFPASGIVGTTVAATVEGSALSGAVASVFGAPGLAVTVQAATDTSVSLQLTIDAAAAPGERIVSLTTAGGTVALAFTVNASGGPIVTGVSPTMTATRGFALDLTFTGQNLAGILPANVTVSGAGVTVSDAAAAGDGTSLDVTLAVAADADLGTHALAITTPAGGAVLLLYVQRPAPTITAVSPGAGEVGAAVPLTVHGANLTGAALVVTGGSNGQGGILVTDVATSDDSTLTATLTVSGSLSPESEPRLLILTTESGQATAEFFVVAVGVPSLTNLRPGAAEPGETVAVTLRGLNLTGATLSTTSPSITLQNPVVVDDETITLDVVVGGAAAAGTDHPIVATVGAQSDSLSFRVVAAGDPFVGAIRPPFGNRGTTIAVIVDGVNLSGVIAGTGVDVTGPKIVESNAQAIDDQTVRAIFEIDPTANVGYRDLTVTTATGNTTRSAAFRVNVPGQVPVITDVVPAIVEPGVTTTITVTGSGFAGAGVAVGGAGAVVSDVAVDGTGSTITFDVTIALDAAPENRAVIVVTENGTATCGILSEANIELRAPLLVKTGAVVEALTTSFRQYVFEFSPNERFDPGPRTCAISSALPVLVLSRLDAERVGRAVRDLPFGYVRVRAVTATNLIGLSDPYRFRR